MPIRSSAAHPSTRRSGAPRQRERARAIARALRCCVRCRRSQATTLVLLEELASRRDVDLGQLAREARLGVDDGRDPLDVGLLGDLLLVVGDRLQRLLVGAQVRTAGLLAGLENMLVELADALDGFLDGL